MSKSVVTWAVLCVLCMPAVAMAGKGAPPDPAGDAQLVTAGFLRHHQDLQYRLLGMDAYKAKRFDKALQYFRRASFFADKPSQGMVAEMYWNGEGTARDRVLAYAWMDLAAERGYAGFLGMRERYWNALDAGERERALAVGQEVYARFGDAAAKPRYEFQLRVARRTMTGSRTGFNRGIKIEIPGPGGSQIIDGSKYHDERYWDARKYWAWHDAIWMKPRIGRVDVGAVESVRDEPAVPSSRIPETRPDVDATAPVVDDAPPTP